MSASLEVVRCEPIGCAVRVRVPVVRADIRLPVEPAPRDERLPWWRRLARTMR